MTLTFNIAKFRALEGGSLDLQNDSIQVALLTANTTATTEEDVTTLAGFTTLGEFDGIGYKAATLNEYVVAGANVSTDTLIDVAIYNVDDFVFRGLQAGTNPVRYILVYRRRNSTFLDSEPLFLLDSVQLPFVPDGSDFTLQFATSNIWELGSGTADGIELVPEEPSQANSGVSIPGILPVWAGATTITTNDTTFSGVTFGSTITVQADNVVFEDCLFETPGDAYGLIVNPGSGVTGLEVRDCEFRLMEEAAIYTFTGTFERLNIHDTGNKGVVVTFPDSTVTFTDCYIHRLGNETYSASIPAIAAHGLELRADSGGTVYVDNCFFDIPDPAGANAQTVLHGAGPYHSDASIYVSSTSGTITGFIQVRECRIRGGDTMVVLENGGNGSPANWSLEKCVWYQEWTTGPISFDGPTKLITGNIRNDTAVSVDSNLAAQTTW